jgi:hypothetical protein
MEKITQICKFQEKKKKKPNSPDFCDKFEYLTKNIEGFYFFSTFISSL